MPIPDQTQPGLIWNKFGMNHASDAGPILLTCSPNALTLCCVCPRKVNRTRYNVTQKVVPVCSCRWKYCTGCVPFRPFEITFALKLVNTALFPNLYWCWYCWDVDLNAQVEMEIDGGKERNDSKRNTAKEREREREEESC